MSLPPPAQPVTRPINGWPEGLSVRRSERFLRLSYHHRSMDTVALTVVALAWAVLPLLLITDIRAQHAAPFILLILLPAIPLTLFVLLAWINTTVIEVGDGEVRVGYRPIPFPAQRQIFANEILQLYLKEYPLDRDYSIARLYALLENGDRVPVTRYLMGHRAAYARTIEREIEVHLGLIDRPMICPKCQYDLRASHKRCPECGTKVRGTKSEPV